MVFKEFQEVVLTREMSAHILGYFIKRRRECRRQRMYVRWRWLLKHFVLGVGQARGSSPPVPGPTHNGGST